MSKIYMLYLSFTVIGASFDPAANNYAGLGPFSEIETRSVSRYIENIGSNLAAFFSLRSFGQRLFVPFAHTTDPMYNYREMVKITYALFYIFMVVNQTLALLTSL